MPHFCGQFATDRVKKAARVADKLVSQQGSRAAARLVFLQMIKLEFARGPVKRGRHCPAGRHDHLLFIGQQVTLGRHATLGAGSAVWLVDFHAAGFAVDPYWLASCRFEGMDIDPVGGPDTGGKVNGVLKDNRSATRRPGRNHPFITGQLAIIRAATKFPQEAPITLRQGVEITIVTGDKDPVLPGCRRKAHRSFGKENPTCLAGF